MALVTEAEKIQGPSPYPETEVFRTMVCTFKSGLADFLSRAERCCSELETMVTVCNFCEQVGVYTEYWIGCCSTLFSKHFTYNML